MELLKIDGRVDTSLYYEADAPISFAFVCSALQLSTIPFPDWLAFVRLNLLSSLLDTEHG